MMLQPRIVLALIALLAIAGAAAYWFSQDSGKLNQPSHFQHASGPSRDAEWDELVPDNWDPANDFGEEFNNLDAVEEGSAEDQALMEKMRKVWDNAPTRAELNKQHLRLPGYVVPLDNTPEGTQTFLLVPYYGACVHSPPPPANQIIMVHTEEPVPFKTMDAVSVTGLLLTERNNSDQGTSGYTLYAHTVDGIQEQR